MTTCRACLRPVGDRPWHRRCARALFGTTRVPEIDVDLARFQTLALATVGRTTLAGVQRKLSLAPSADGRTLRVELGRALYILKPESRDWEALPANEHLTMNLARLSGLEVPPFGLVELADGSEAFLVRRFDRLADGAKLACEDFCQLAELPPKDKYEGSLESCGRLVERFASEPGIGRLLLYRRAVFAWWTGDGDLHRKNLSLLRHPDGSWRLSPVYDAVSTHLLIPRDELALTVQGKRGRLTRATWLAFADALGLPRRAAERALSDQASVLDDALALVAKSALPPDQGRAHADWLRERSEQLRG